MDHHALWQLVQEFKEFLSPIIFVSVAMDAYFICLQVSAEIYGLLYAYQGQRNGGTVYWLMEFYFSGFIF